MQIFHNRFSGKLLRYKSEEVRKLFGALCVRQGAPVEQNALVTHPMFVGYFNKGTDMFLKFLEDEKDIDLKLPAHMRGPKLIEAVLHVFFEEVNNDQ